MSYRVLRACLPLAAVVLGLLAGTASASTLEQANAQSRQWIQQKMQDERIPGLQIAVVKEGRIVLSESYGLANVENAVPATRATLFPINSATKAFTGVAVMQLVQAGKLALDAPLGRYLDDVPAAWRAVRIHQLLAHTSGLPEIVDAQGSISPNSERQAWEAAMARPIQAAAGSRFDYNQTNYALLQRLIEKQSGIPYDRFVAEQQLAVAGMPLSRFGDSYDLVPNAATIYSTSPRGTSAPDDATRLSHWFYDVPYGLWAGAALQTTAEEVAHWLIALSDGKLINADNLQRMWTPETLNDGSAGAWGAGWPVLQASTPRQVAGIGGARAAFFVYPDQGLAIIVLTNRAGANPQRFIPQLATFYLPAE